MGFIFSSVEVFNFFLFFCEKNIFQIFHFKKLGKNKPLVMNLHKLWLAAGCSSPLKLHMSSMPGPPEPSQQIAGEWKLDKLRTRQQEGTQFSSHLYDEARGKEFIKVDGWMDG
jgi:hypothetical protein